MMKYYNQGDGYFFKLLHCDVKTGQCNVVCVRVDSAMIHAQRMTLDKRRIDLCQEVTLDAFQAHLSKFKAELSLLENSY